MLTKKTPDFEQITECSEVFIDNFEHVNTRWKDMQILRKSLGTKESLKKLLWFIFVLHYG